MEDNQMESNVMVMSKKRRWITTGLLLFYFAFTSGAVFEATKSTAIDKIDIPYSIGLSAERAGTTALANQDDIDCFNWLVENWDGKTHVIGDYNSSMMLFANVPNFYDFYNDIHLYNFNKLPDECYIFISHWNAERNQYIKATGVGLREIKPLPELNYPVVYQTETALLYKKETQ